MNNIKQVFPVVQPSEFQLNFAVSCCSCGEDQCTKCGANDGSCCSSDGKKSDCECRAFNTVFTLFQTEDNPNKYRCEFDQHKPAGASRVELVLANVAKNENGEPDKDNPMYIACASIHFEDPLAPTVSWISTGFEDYTRIGTMRSRVNSSKCCFPKTITCNAPPQPDFCAPHREWQASDPDDLNGSPFFPQIDIDIPEDCPEAPVRYANGELNLRAKDLSSNGFGVPWGHTRIYSNRLSNNYDYGCGMNWLIHEQPMLVIHERKRKRAVQINSEINEQEVTRAIAVVRGTRNALWFDEDDWHDETMPNPAWSENRTAWEELTPRFGQSHELKHCTDQGIFRLMAPNGHVWEFYDFETRENETKNGNVTKVANPAPGRLYRHLGPGRQATTLIYDPLTCKLLRTERTGDGVTEKFENEFITAGENFGRIRSVTHKRTGHSNPNINGNIQKVVYSYYGKCDDKCQPLEHGKCGDLRFAAVQIPDRINNTRWQNLNIHYYRHHIEGDFYSPIGKTQPENETPLWQVEQLPYCQGLVAEVFSPEDFRHLYRAIYNIQTERGDFLKIGNLPDDPNWICNLEKKLDKAKHSFEIPGWFIAYDAEKRIKLSVESTELFTRFQYLENENSYPETNGAPEFNVMRMETKVVRSDSSKRTTYCNLIGLPLATKLSDGTENFFQSLVFHPITGNLLRLIEPSSLQLVVPGGSTTLGSNVLDVTDAPLGGDPIEQIDEIKIHGLQIVFQSFGTDHEGGLIQSINFSQQAPGQGVAAFSLKRIGNGNKVEHFLKRYGYSRDQEFEITPGFSIPLNILKFDINYIDPENSIYLRYVHTWHPGTNAPLPAFRNLTIELPVVPASQNGNGKQAQQVTTFDRFGYPETSTDARGIKNRMAFEVGLGALNELTEDVAGRAAKGKFKSRFGLKRTTTFENDRFGRAIFVAGPKHDVWANSTAGSVADRSPASVHSTVLTQFNDIEGEVWTGPGYAAFRNRADHKFINPVAVTFFNRNGQQIRAVECRWIGTPYNFGSAVPDRSRWSRLSDTEYDRLYRLTSQKDYYDIKQQRFHLATVQQYDALSRTEVTVSADGTKTKILYDVRSLELERQIGRFALNSDGGGLTPIFKHFRNALGLPIQTIRYVGMNGCLRSDENRIYTMKYDWRGRLLSEATQIGVAYTNEYGKRVIDEPESRTDLNAGNQGQRRVKNCLDSRGRVYRTIVTGSFVKNGTRFTPKNKTVTDFVYDQANNLIDTHFSESGLRGSREANGKDICQLKDLAFNKVGLHRKTDYDGLNRPYRSRVLWYENEIESVETCFDLADNVTLQKSTQLDRNDNDFSYELAITNATWHDALGRVVASANYGTNAVAQRPACIPVRSDDILVSNARYNHRGELDLTRAPDYTLNVKGDTKFAFDDLGRNTITIEAFNNGNFNRRRSVVKTYHPSNQIHTISLLNFPATSGINIPALQTTRYHYGTSLGTSSIAHGSLLAKVTYPDGTTTQFAYNKQGQPVEFTDQNRTEHCYTYDKFGRQTADAIKTPGKSVDSSVRRLETKFDSQGRIRTVTSLDKATSGDVLNSVTNTYEDLNLISDQQQNHFASQTGWSTGYVYNNSRQAGPRLGELIYPGMITQPHEEEHVRDGRLPRKVHLQYGDRTDDYFLGRPAELLLESIPSPDKNQENRLRQICLTRYGGTGSIVTQSFIEKYISSGQLGTLQIDDESGRFDLRDTLGRPRKAQSISSGSFLNNLLYRYGQAHNILTRRDLKAAPNHHDDAYTYDQLNRSKSITRGKLVTENTIANPVLEENWAIDTAENWNAYEAISADNRIATENQTRDHNRINQIKAIGSQSRKWVTPEYDAAGNMIVMPQPNDPTKKFHCKYDGWHRLVEVRDDNKLTVIARYQYDAMGRRIVKEVDSQWRHYFYDADGMVIEERVASSAKQRPAFPDRQFYWSPDGRLLAVDYSEIVDIESGSPTQFPRQLAKRTHRLVPLHDLLGSTVALFNIDDSINPVNWEVDQRLGYSAYGQIYQMDKDFNLLGPGLDSEFDFDYLFAGYRIDRETGLYHTHYRQFHPGLGTWNGQDPMGYRDSLDLYQYSLNNPVKYSDPTGGMVDDGIYQGAAGGSFWIPKLDYITRFAQDFADLNNRNSMAQYSLAQTALNDYPIGTRTQYLPASTNLRGAHIAANWRHYEGKLHFIDRKAYLRSGGKIHSNNAIFRSILANYPRLRGQMWLDTQANPGIAKNFSHTFLGKGGSFEFLPASEKKLGRFFQRSREFVRRVRVAGEYETLLEGDIRKSALRSRAQVRFHQTGRWAGRVLIPLGIYVTANNLAHAYDQGSLHNRGDDALAAQTIRDAGGWGGGILGGATGGAIAGTFSAGPLGTIAGAIIGGIVGGYTGYEVGDYFGDQIYEN